MLKYSFLSLRLQLQFVAICTKIMEKFRHLFYLVMFIAQSCYSTKPIKFLKAATAFPREFKKTILDKSLMEDSYTPSSTCGNLCISNPDCDIFCIKEKHCYLSKAYVHPDFKGYETTTDLTFESCFTKYDSQIVSNVGVIPYLNDYAVDGYGSGLSNEVTSEIRTKQVWHAQYSDAFYLIKVKVYSYYHNSPLEFKFGLDKVTDNNPIIHLNSTRAANSYTFTLHSPVFGRFLQIKRNNRRSTLRLQEVILYKSY